MKWYFNAFKQYAVFRGRASRTAFWTFFLINIVISFIMIAIDIGMDNPGYLDAFYSLISFLPCLAITVRRLHDADLSAWWLLVVLIPMIGMLILLYLLTLPSAPRSLLLSGGLQ